MPFNAQRWNPSGLYALLVCAAVFEMATIATVSASPLESAAVKLAADEPSTGQPGDAAPPKDETFEAPTLATEPLSSCMARWDAGTHMTKKAWQETCKRITRERLPYVKGYKATPPAAREGAR